MESATSSRLERKIMIIQHLQLCHLLYEVTSISSGNSVMFTSNLSCTEFNTLASFSSDTNVMASPLVPNLPARATYNDCIDNTTCYIITLTRCK